MTKLYNILLDDTLIGTTRFEHADPFMGVVFGRINTTDISYEILKEYCLKNNIGFEDLSDIKFISTFSIPGLRIFDVNSYEIKGEVCNISGMDQEGFDIYILGIPYPFYGEEFVHHITAHKKG